MQLLTLFNYLWVKRSVVGAKHYAMCATLEVIVASFEISILQNEGYGIAEAVMICISLVAFISLTSYNQVHLAIGYVISILYVFLRTYFHLCSDNPSMSRYFKFNFLFIASLFLSLI